MTGKRYARQLARDRRAEKFGRTVLSASLNHALASAGLSLSPARVARWMSMSARALRRWRGGAKITGVEDIIDEPELALAFAKCLQTQVLKRMKLERGGC